jgi:hypothetical protein
MAFPRLGYVKSGILHRMRGLNALSFIAVSAFSVASACLAGCRGVSRTTLATVPVEEPTQITDLRPLWDTGRVLHNPYKGWYHHYYDNGTRNYRLSSDADLDQFPGMDHLYIRLSWAHFEPEEGRFSWSCLSENPIISSGCPIHIAANATTSTYPRAHQPDATRFRSVCRTPAPLRSASSRSV